MTQKLDISCDSPPQWETCEPGTLGRFQSMAAAQSRSSALKTGGTAAIAVCGLLLVAGLAALLNSGSRSDLENRSNFENLPRYGGLTCPDVIDCMPQYFAGNLDAQKTQLTHKHLQDCVKCREHFARQAESLGVTLDLVADSAPYHPTANWNSYPIALGSSLAAAPGYHASLTRRVTMPR